MLASELIKKLQKQVDIHGDSQVCIEATVGKGTFISTVEACWGSNHVEGIDGKCILLDWRY